MNKLKKKLLDRQVNVLFNRWLFLFKENEYQVKKKFLFILNSNQIEINEVKSSLNYLYLYEEYYTSNRLLLISIIKKLKKFFEILDINNSYIIIYFSDRVFKIYFNNKISRVRKEKILRSLVFFYKIKSIYHKNFCLNYLRNFLNKTFSSKKKIMNLSGFLNLNFYPNEIDKLIRLENLSLITNNFEHFKIKDILEHFKFKNNKFKTYKKINFNKKLLNESLNSLIPISFNLKYWQSSNFFLYKNIYFGFFKKNIAYESQNKNNNFKFLLDKKLNTINDERKIKNILNENPIVIINNRVYSGRNRVLSLLGHLLQNGSFVEFNYNTYFSDDMKMNKLRNILVEYFNFQKLNNLTLFDNNKEFMKIFDEKNIKYKKIKLKNNCFNSQFNQILSKKKIFEIVEVKSFFDIIFSVKKMIFKENLSFFYYDKKNKINIFNKNLFFKNFFKILLTIFKPNLVFVISKKNGIDQRK